GLVAANGDPVRGRVGTGVGELQTSAEEPQARSLIAVPLRASGRITGVLGLYDKDGAAGFDRGDLETIRTFASQATVAIDNVLLHQEAQRLSITDGLTGLWNYRYFTMTFAKEIERSSRFGRPLALLLLDLDKFKDVNDTQGHLAGDQLLVEVGERLKSQIREIDVLARLGGDEFAIIQEGGAEQHEGATALALRIIKAITRPFDLGGLEANVGISIGIALAPLHGMESEELLRSADLALYDAKANGRNDCRIFRPEMLEHAHTQKLAESELRDAIAREEFVLHYQPLISAETRLLCGVEALVRWRHPERGFIAPDQFIPLAESSGLIMSLGEWVLRKACEDAASWPAHIKVAVNISAVQFRRGDLFDTILRTLLESGLAPDRLELEITETAVLENQETHLATIRRLKNLGISMALDDFGTGYSAVNYLTTFPFDKIKIDKSFTQGVLDRRDCKAVIASTLALAQGLGIMTTAEGIETEEQFNYMRKAGIDLAQGYLFGRPVPAAQLDLSGGPPLDISKNDLRESDARQDDARQDKVA
ncbi:MAG TPA: bifunctional diguanylate cyclase/phosphodiesterase, partial [Bradyrhizobium sp.]